MNQPDYVTENLITSLEIALLKREIEILRQWGNKDCTNMADEAIQSDQNHKIILQVIGDIKDKRRLVIPESEGLCPADTSYKPHILGYN